MTKGQIYKIHSDFYYIKSENELFECKLREVLKKQKQSVFVGDYVEFSDGAIEKILPRKNFIIRPSVANIEQIIVVSSVKEPVLDLLQLNRYIALAKYYNIKAVLCFNKNDLSDNDSVIEQVFSIYEPLGFDILFTSAIEDYGIEEFKDILKNKISALCGNSGVGKSSLINKTFGKDLRTGSISEKSQRGTHTTRHCEIIEIDKNTAVVDTPGFSNLEFNFLMPNEVDLLFPEIAQYKNKCKFKNCLHINETDCVVKSNIGKIHPTRYESYVAFAEEAQKFKNKVKQQGTKKEILHKNNNNKTTVKINSKKRQSARNTQKQSLLEEIKNERID